MHHTRQGTQCLMSGNMSNPGKRPAFQEIGRMSIHTGHPLVGWITHLATETLSVPAPLLKIMKTEMLLLGFDRHLGNPVY